MKAAVLRGPNEPLTINNLDFFAFGPGQVMVDVAFAGICGAQIREITGAAGPDRYLPHLLGHEGAGIVTKVGPGVRTVAPGDHVVLHWRKGAGIDADPPRYYCYESGEYIGAGPVATWGTRVMVSENRATQVPRNLPLRYAALFGCAVTTGLGIIDREARLRMGETILVIGAGGVGLCVIQGASLAGARLITALDRVPEKGALAKQCGAHEFLTNFSSVEAQYDVVVDFTGSPEAIAAGLDRVKSDGGRMILAGQPPHGSEVKIRGNYRGVTIKDSQGGGTIPHLDIPRYVGLWSAGMLGLECLASQEYPLDEINTAVEAVKQGRVDGRCLIRM